jgi:hypothetical protein
LPVCTFAQVAADPARSLYAYHGLRSPADRECGLARRDPRDATAQKAADSA